ncbi:response regulator transcription factor [Paucihalobacter sp.]|uniref:response regulator transcription factor n=1 Tax=Paucihalobacter sp. TaxID=2850405 RepID=UPI002FE0DED5
MTTKIAITDDHQLVLKGIAAMLDNVNEVEITGAYSTISETEKGIAENQPDVLFLDINLPDGNGIDLSKLLSKKYPTLKIIALTNFEDISFVKRMLKNGAHGYLLKNTDKIELMKAIKTVLSDTVYLPDTLHNKLLYQSHKQESNKHLAPKLTKREMDVLRGISEELTTEEISQKLFVSPKTVETHRMNIMSKLGAKNSVGIIKIAIEKHLL